MSKAFNSEKIYLISLLKVCIYPLKKQKYGEIKPRCEERSTLLKPPRLYETPYNSKVNA